MTSELDRLADAYGIGLAFVDEMGNERHPSDEAKRRLLSALGVPAQSDEEVRKSLTQIDHPACYIPSWLEDGRVWGITCQLYGLRSKYNWGIGDFEDLARLAELAANAGADFIGVSPLHALFFAEPRHFSPYAPSSRRFLNPLYIALDPSENLSSADQALLEAARNAELVDYQTTAQLKWQVLGKQFERFLGNELNTQSAEAQAFQAFQHEHGARLETFAVFEALSETMVQRGMSCGWHGWPETFKDKDSEAVRAFAYEHRDRVLFHKWLQWVAHNQLVRAQQRALAAGMRIGLYLDLAVGVSQDGADTWSDPDLVLRGVRIGCPPDAFNAKGQDWGLAPISPGLLQADRGRSFGALIADAIGPAGAVRIDHAMSLMRLYLIADGLDSTDGAYVIYPFNDMLRALSNVSQGSQTVIIGEDLGTVPPNFRETMQATRILGYRVLFFEREGDGGFRLPEQYERDALACLSTHDLPTLSGWWEEHDLIDREQIGLDDIDAAPGNRAQRAKDRELLIAALAASGLLPDRLGPVARSEQPVPAELPQDLAVGLTRFLARTPCRLVAIQLEDLAGMKDRANLPGTTDEHPNWRRKLPLTLETLPQSADFVAITLAIAEERPRRP